MGKTIGRFYTHIYKLIIQYYFTSRFCAFFVGSKKSTAKWYLAFLLSISLLALAIVNFWVNFSGKELLSDHIGIVEALGLILLMLLAPFSTMLFLSLHKHPDSMNISIAVLSVVSMLSMLLLFLTLDGLSDVISSGGPTFDAVAAFTLLYWFFLMPIIGICFLVSAITYKDSENILSPETVRTTQN